MFFSMGISLYTSRVVLNTLGVEDFGIYNLVGGIVVLFSFVNGAMTNATQRFLNFEMGKNNTDAIQKVFSVSVNAHLLIMGIVLLLSETVGLWFLNYKLNIPANRMFAANVVFQFSVLTFCIGILSVPYQATIIAYEKMSLYAWITIFQIFLKLIIVFLLVLFIYDKLILYSILVFGVGLITFLMYHFLCRRKFKTCHYHFTHDKKIFRELLSFSGWSLFGNVALIGASQGVSMVMNIFLGVAINASMGVAAQVNTAVYGFVSNFQMAFSPQITKTYASNNLVEHKKLIFQASKFSFYLSLIFATPILLNTEYILTLWLKIVPNYAVEFTQLTILGSLFQALSGPFWMSANAIGNIKNYQIGISLIIILNLPLSYFILYYNYSPVYVFIVNLVLSILAYFFRLVYVKSKIKFSFSDVFEKVYFKIIMVSLVNFSILYYLKKVFLLIDHRVFSFLIFSIICVITTLFLIVSVGISKSDKIMIYSLVRNKFFNKGN